MKKHLLTLPLISALLGASAVAEPPSIDVKQIKAGLSSEDRDTQTAALKNIESLGAKGESFIPNVLQLYHRLDFQSQLKMTSAVGDALFAIRTPKTVPAYLELMRSNDDGQANVTFLRYLRMQMERGDDILPLIIDTLADTREPEGVRRAIFIIELMNFDKGIDHLMGLLKGSDSKQKGAWEILMGVLNIVSKLEPEGPGIMERAATKCLPYLNKGTQDQTMMAVAVMASARPAKDETAKAIARRIEAEADPEFKAKLIKTLKHFAPDK